jgi:hypothetical protein
MTEGEKIILLRALKLDMQQVMTDIADLKAELKKLKEVVKSPISRALYASRQGGSDAISEIKQQEGGVGEHSS